MKKKNDSTVGLLKAMLKPSAASKPAKAKPAAEPSLRTMARTPKKRAR